MKKVIFIVAFLFLFSSNIDIHANETTINQKTENIGALTNSENLIEIFSFENQWIFLTSLKNEEGQERLTLRNQEVMFFVDSSYQAHLRLDNLLFLATDDTLYKINLFNYQFEEFPLSMEIVNHISFHNEILWLVGSNEEDAFIQKMNFSGEVLGSYQYGGSGFECFDQILWIEDNPYLTGHKDAYSYQSPFENVGNQNDNKAFITRMLSNFQIADTIYFNHQTNNEVITSSYLKDNQIYLFLKANEAYHLYSLDDGLNIVFYQELKDTLEVLGVISDSSYFVGVHKRVEGIYWQVFGETWNEERTLSEVGEVVSANIGNGELEVFVVEERIIKKITCNEYHILSLKPFYISRLNSDVESLNNLWIESYFEGLNFQIKTIEPYFDKLISGTYDVIYVANRENGTSIEVSSQIIVEEYANVVNDGVYSVGHILSFFGNANLNGQGILNGYQLETPGHYQLILSNVQGEKRTIEFDVVSDFYQKEVSLQIPSDIYIDQGETVFIPILYQDVENIEAILVNGEMITDFNKLDDGVEFAYIGPDYPNYACLQIEKLLLKSGKEVPIFDDLIIATRKQTPQIMIEEKEEDNLTLLLRLNDPNQAIIDIETLVYQDEKLLKSYSSYLQDYEIDFEIDSNATYRIITQARYELGDGVVYKKKLIDYEGTINKSNYTFLTIDAKRLGSVIDEVEIVVHTNSSKLHHHFLRINNVDIAKKYQIERNMKLINSVLLLTGGTIIIFGILIIRKRKQKII